VDRETEFLAVLRVICNIEYLFAGNRVVTQHPDYWIAPFQSFLQKTKLFQHGLPHRLNHQAGTDRCGLPEPLVQHDTVPGAVQKQS